MRSRLRIAVIVAAMSVGCGDSPTAPDPTTGDLRNAPLTITVDGTSVALQASLWRNLMPSVQPSGSPLFATMRLSAAVTSATLDRVWVLLGEQSWETTPERLGPRRSGWRAAVRNGRLAAAWTSSRACAGWTDARSSCGRPIRSLKPRTSRHGRTGRE